MVQGTDLSNFSNFWGLRYSNPIVGMKQKALIRAGVTALIFTLSLAAGAQNLFDVDNAPVLSFSAPSNAPVLEAIPTPAQPRMAPELALQSFQKRAAQQLLDLGAYTDTTTIEAELPATSQRGSFQLRRTFAAPKSLAFTAVKFVGDGFIKTNVITRLLQSEAEAVQKGGGASTAIAPENYKFSYKGTDDLFGLPVYVFQLKPRAKRAGLFKGRIYLDVYSGRIRRAEGTMVKSPSFFVKKINFTQDYAEFGTFSLPVHIHSEAQTRLIGPAVVDIYHGSYQAKSMAETRSEGSGVAAGDAPQQ